MRDFEDFTAVNDPREYLNAPAMVLTDGADSRTPKTPSPPPKLPMIVGAAIEYSSNFEILSADELQQYYAEQTSLERRLQELVNRLDVEFKMREAAQSISRLHAGDTLPSGNRRTSFQSTRSSVTMSIASSPKLNHRLSKMFGQDSQSKADRRLSKQAAEEAETSADKIRDLETARAEIERRKATVDKTIIQHHCAVMSRALSSKPLPNHQRSRSGASNLSQNSNRQSWIMAPKHQRQWSSNSNGDAISLATVTEHALAPASRGSMASPANGKSQLEEEIDSLIARISQALPQVSPAPQGKVAFLASIFDRMMRDLIETRSTLEASHVQIDHSKQRLQYMMQQHNELQAQNGSRELALRSPGHEVALRETQDALEAEQAKTLSWRTRAEQQRQQLEIMAKSLEDVTQLAVRLENSQSNYEQLVATLETKVSDLLTEKEDYLQQRLRSTTNPSLLCQEFQKIVSDLVARHDEEVRSLYPKFPKTRLPRDVSLQDIQSQLSETKLVKRKAIGPSQPDLKQSEYAKNEPKSVEQSSSVPLKSDRRLSREPRTSPYLQETSGLPRLDRENSIGRNSISRNSVGRASIGRTSADRNSTGHTSTGRTSTGPNSPTSPVLNQTQNQTHNQKYNQNHNKNQNTSKALYRSSAYASSDLNLPSDSIGYRRTPSPLQVPDMSNASMRQTAAASFDDSIQPTEDDYILRPELDRYDTEASDYSKSSSYYPEAPSANQSQVSIIGRPSQNRGKTKQVRNFSYENADDEIL